MYTDAYIEDLCAIDYCTSDLETKMHGAQLETSNIFLLMTYRLQKASRKHPPVHCAG